MPFNVNDFISNLQFDGARPNLFDITMPFPAGVPNESAVLSFMARGASLPAANLGVANVPYFGRQVKLMGNRTFDNWPITIINDEDFRVRDAFEFWSTNINSHVSNVLVGNYKSLVDYATNATITQYDKGGNAIKEYTMVGAWPSSVQAIETSWDSNNVVEEFTVTLEYQWWMSNTAAN
jgi:hypothetical protein